MAVSKIRRGSREHHWLIHCGSPVKLPGLELRSTDRELCGSCGTATAHCLTACGNISQIRLINITSLANTNKIWPLHEACDKFVLYFVEPRHQSICPPISQHIMNTSFIVWNTYRGCTYATPSPPSCSYVRTRWGYICVIWSKMLVPSNVAACLPACCIMFSQRTH
jgi:hypothetical protein